MKNSIYISIAISFFSLSLVGQKNFDFPESLIIRFDSSDINMNYVEIWKNDKQNNSILISRSYVFNNIFCPGFVCSYYSAMGSVAENQYDYLIKKKELKRHVLLNGELLDKGTDEKMKLIEKYIIDYYSRDPYQQSNIFIYDVNNQRYKRKILLRKVLVNICFEE